MNLLLFWASKNISYDIQSLCDRKISHTVLCLMVRSFDNRLTSYVSHKWIQIFLNGAVTSITLYCIGGVFRCDHIPTTKMTEITINSRSKRFDHAYGTKFSLWFCGFMYLFLMGSKPIFGSKSFLIWALFQVERRGNIFT